jgi:phage tail-like protein
MADPLINQNHGLDTDPVRNFRFLVTFNPKDSTGLMPSKKASLGFVSVSGLNVTTDSISYREGGYNTTVHQIPGMTTFTPITLNRGVLLGTPQHYEWMKRMFALTSSAGNGGVGADFRCDVQIQVLSHPNATGLAGSGAGAAGSPEDLHTSLRFKVYNAWITNLSYSDLNAGDNNLFVESLTLVHEGWDVHWAKDLKETAAIF